MTKCLMPIALLLAAAPLAAQQMSWPQPQRTVFNQPRSEVPITRLGGYPVVEVDVNGRTFRFALETGASFFGVSSRLAQSLGLTLRVPEGANAQGPQQVTIVDSVRLGGVTFHGVTAAVSARFEARDLDGVVSPPLLREVLYTIDLRNNRLSLERGSLPEVDNGQVLAISRKDRGGRIDFPLAIGNVTVDPVIDTQSLLEVIIADSLESSIALAAAPLAIGQASGPAQGTFTLRGARSAAETRVGNTVVTAMPIIFRNRAGPVAGVAFLENFVITVDDRNGRVRFVPHTSPVSMATVTWEARSDQAARAASMGSRGRFMLGLRTSGNPTTVNTVEAGSNIDKAGIRVGDVLLEVDGIPLERMTPQEWQRVLETGSPVKLTLSRNGQRVDALVTPIQR